MTDMNQIGGDLAQLNVACAAVFDSVSATMTTRLARAPPRCTTLRREDASPSSSSFSRTALQ